MTTFLIISAVMVAIAILLLAPTLLRSSHRAVEDTREHNIRIARERLGELEKAKTGGELSDEEFNQAREDLEIALAQDLSTATASTEHSDSKGTARLTLLIVAVVVPVIATLTYQETGSPQHLHVAGPGQKQAAQHTDQLPPISDLVGELEKRLQAEPNNPEGWFLLGRTYMRMQRYSDAVRAYARLNEVMPNNPSVLVSMVDAMTMNEGGRVPEKGVALLEDALQADPESTTALWLAGNAAAQREQDQKALDYWSRALPLLAEQPQMQEQLRGLIGEVEARSGLKADVAPALPSIMAAAPAAIPAMPPATAQEAAPSAEQMQGLQVEVALDAELLERVSDNDTVFVYAKAAAGPPMPLAVSRQRVADLPVRVVLNDSMAMMPQMKLSSFEQVLVGARISKSGQAMPQPGDLQSNEVETASNSNEGIQLLINQQRP